MQTTRYLLAAVSAAALALALTVAVAPAQSPGPSSSSCTTDGPPTLSPRIATASFEGIGYDVLLPSGYATSGLRYPVLYLLHGLQYNQHSWLDHTDIEQFTAPFTGRNAAIVVMPDGGPAASYVDYADGSADWETYHVYHLIPHIDQQFRTIADRAHRAIAGFSIGGFGAADYAARHPDLFVADGIFSGLVDLTPASPPYRGPSMSSPSVAGVRTAARYTPPTTCGGNNSLPLFGSLGNPLTDYTNWRAHNPTDLASNLRGVSLDLASGNGIPCGPQDIQAIPTGPLGAGGETAVLALSQKFDAALSDAHVAHTTNFYGCGLHLFPYWQRDLHAFWPQMTAAFGTPPPTSFNYRSADPIFSLWGWTLTADPKRAHEFLEITNASPAGLTLTGSGTETVATPAIFAPGQTVHVYGATQPSDVAGSDGRLTLHVDLGPAHIGQQFTLAGEINETFITRTVRFSPAGTRHAAQVRARRHRHARRRHKSPHHKKHTQRRAH